MPHTPGPWTPSAKGVDFNEWGNYDFQDINCDTSPASLPLIRVFREKYKSDILKADVQLIAQAPNMLASLKAFFRLSQEAAERQVPVDLYLEDFGWFEQTQAIIEMAEGGKP